MITILNHLDSEEWGDHARLTKRRVVGIYDLKAILSLFSALGNYCERGILVGEVHLRPLCRELKCRPRRGLDLQLSVLEQLKVLVPQLDDLDDP